MELEPISQTTPRTPPTGGGADELTADDFLKLLVAQLSNQDPLEPTSNETILQQLSAIRDIQLSTSLSESLQTLTGNQKYGAVAALIGKHVTGRVGNEDDGYQSVSGKVTGVLFGDDGKAVLMLDSGEQLPLEKLESVSGEGDEFDSLIGQSVRGQSASGDDGPQLVEGVVTAVRRDNNGNAVLELDTGDSIPASDLLAAA